jgi:cytoskeletal protein RodZ
MNYVRRRVGGAGATDSGAWAALPGEEVGTYLRRTREALGIPLAQVSFTTRIPVASLRLVEEGRFHELPGETFARGFVRAYAGAIGLPPQDAIRVLENHDRPTNAPALRAPSPAELRSRRVGVAFALLILAVVLTLIVSMFLRGSGKSVRDLSGRDRPDATVFAERPA